MLFALKVAAAAVVVAFVVEFVVGVVVAWTFGVDKAGRGEDGFEVVVDREGWGSRPVSPPGYC